MSVANALTFIHKLDEDTQLAAQVRSNEDAVQVASEVGILFTESDLDSALKIFSSELSADELQKTAAARCFPCFL